MSTGPIQPENTESTAQSAPDGGGLQAVVQTAQAAIPESSATATSSVMPPLPPRIDGGDDLDNVLGEVSRIFGQADGHAAPLASLAEDYINDHLADLTASDAVPSAGPQSSNQNVSVEAAGDLFRALPPLENVPVASEPAEAVSAEASPNLAPEPDVAAEQSPPDEANSNADPAARSSVPNLDANESVVEQHSRLDDASDPVVEDPGARPTQQKTDGEIPATAPSVAAPAAHRARPTFQTVGRTARHFPRGARVAAGMLVSALLGWIAGTALSRSSATPTVAETQAGQSTNEDSVAESPADKSKIAALAEQLQKAQQESEVARHERDQAREHLERSTASLLTERKLLADKGALAEAKRKQAMDDFRKAEDRVQLTELRAYDAQLARVRDSWQRNPGSAAALLEDQNGCPTKLREFAWGYFYARVKNDRATWRGSAPVRSIAWSPDGKLLASAAQDGSITLRDAISGAEIASLAAHSGGVNALAFSQRGDWLASAGADSSLKLWDTATRRLEATFFGHLGAVLAVAIAPDSSALVSGGDDGTVKFWDVASRRAVATRWGHPRNREPDDASDPSRLVGAVTFSPDGRLVASGGYQVVRLWDANAVEKTTLTVPEGAVGALTFSADGRTLAIGTDRSISVRDVESLLLRSGPQPVDGPVNALSFSADGAWLGAASGENGIVFGRRVRPVRDESQTAGNRGEEDAASYDLANPHRFSGHDGAVAGIAFSPDSKSVATGGADGTVRLWNPEQGGIVDKSQPDVVLWDLPRAAALAYSPNSSTLAIGTSDSIRLWNIRDGVETARLTNRSGEITRLTFSPDGEHLASASRDWPILIWSVSAQRVQLALNGHTAGVNSLAYSADGKILLSAGDDGTVRLWNTATGVAIGTLSGHNGPVVSAALSSDARSAASGGADGIVRLWSIDRKQSFATLAGAGPPAVALAFSPDGRFLVSAEGHPSARTEESALGAEKSLRLWAIPEGKEVLAFGAGVDLRDVAFSPDSKTLATAGPARVTLWDPRTGELRGNLPFPSTGAEREPQLRGGVSQFGWPVAFSPDGRTLAAGGRSAPVIWKAAPLASAALDKTAAMP
jgi:WD40 repeat protein